VCAGWNTLEFQGRFDRGRPEEYFSLSIFPFFRKEIVIRPRIVVLAVVLAACVVGVGLKIHSVWQAGPWDLPETVSRASVPPNTETEAGAKPAPGIAGTETIIARNLFDPERGASRTKEAEADMRAAQRIRSLVLLGTAILGNNRYAIVQEGEQPQRPGVAAEAATQGPRRMKLGDSLDGFNLAEVSERSVVFAKGTTRVEVPVDYLRKVPVSATPATPQPRAPGAVPSRTLPGQIAPSGSPGQSAPVAVPRVVPNLPRRPRLPAAPES
jgi:hypothetical protein